MKSPFTGNEMSIQKEMRTMSFRKEDFEILFHFYKCEDTGEQFEDDALAELNYNQVINQYRAKHNIPFPDQMIAIRGKYEVSAAKMSEILGLGVNSYRQYESGEVPNQSNARLIHLVKDPHEFERLVNICSTLKEKEIINITKKTRQLIEEQKAIKTERHVESYLLQKEIPDSTTGYKTPDFKKLTEMVVFFTGKMQPWKTKMNKLLFYADFSHFKQTGFSISGINYRAIPMGPVPNNFNSIFEYLANKNKIDIFYTPFPDGGIGEQFNPNPQKQFNTELFSEKELSVLEEIAVRFKSTTTKEIIEISHKEKAWIENHKEKKIIDYNYGFELI